MPYTSESEIIVTAEFVQTIHQVREEEADGGSAVRRLYWTRFT